MTPRQSCRNKFLRTACLTYLAVLLPSCTLSQTADPLKQGFENPPAGARPRVWWHWMNGNISEEGIKLDEEWMKRIGIAGFQNFDAALSTPQVVKQRLAYMTPEWKDAFRYATTTAEQLDLEMAIAGSPGWSETGGPWVPPSEGMKKYVWAETEVIGGEPFKGKLNHPPTVTGPFQGLTFNDSSFSNSTAKLPPQFYADGPVIAYKRAAADVPPASLEVRITSSSGSPDPAMLSDGDLEKTTKLPIPKAIGEASWIQWEYPQPVSIRSVTFAIPSLGQLAALSGTGEPDKILEASDDGKNFHQIISLSSSGGSSAPQHTIGFPAVKARFFRVLFKRTPPPPIPAWAQGIDFSTLGIKVPPRPTDYEIAELALHSGARVDHFEEKAAFVPAPDLYGFATPPADQEAVISRSDVIDLTGKMHADGTLDWTPPLGNWVVVRFGYSLQGTTNHPATAEATGLEVDKLNRTFVKNYMTKYLDSYKDTVGADAMGHKGIKYIITDSWEAGSQNWTDHMMEEFKARRGYDATPWLPVLTGHVVGSSEESDKLLWDFRKTIADLIADEHYGQVEASIRERGMGHYGESHEDGRAFVADGMEVKKLDEVPMAAMWTQTPGVNHEQFNYNADDRESSSVAHIYGQNIASAESMTAAAAPWAWSPATLKPTADQELLNGINRFVIHESAHQPLVGPHTAPGLTLGPFGQWFNRNETWAEEAKPWIDYIARSSFLLQQGHFAADLLCFYGEDSNLTAIFHEKAPDIPPGYGFDYVNADALIHEFTVTNGRIVTKSGMNYKLLALDAYARHMSLPVLRAIHKLVAEGAVVAGAKPVDDPSLADDAAEFAKLNNDLFGGGSGEHHFGKGKVFAGMSLTDAFAAMNLRPDFDYSKPGSNSRLLFNHRKLADGDLYFVDNRGDHDANVDASFRVTGKAPELWHPETAQSEPVSFKIANGVTTIPMHLEPWGTVFVVFRRPTVAMARTIAKPVQQQLGSIDGPWKVTFQPDMGAPSDTTLDALVSWSDSSDPGIKYYSGTGTYTRTIDVPSDWIKPGSHLWLDLGDVKNLAEVTINGNAVGEVWHAPYRIDISKALKPGSNELVVAVQNAWVNRMIGDQQPGVKVKYTYADVTPYKANSPLLPSGLLGPVSIYSERSK